MWIFTCPNCQMEIQYINPPDDWLTPCPRCGKEFKVEFPKSKEDESAEYREHYQDQDKEQ